MSPAREMPSFTKPPGELAHRFSSELERLPGAQQRKMFGQPAAFANGHMFTGLFGSSWFVRLPEDAAAELLQLDGAGPFEPMPGRPMKGYVVLPEPVVTRPAALQDWLERAFAYATSLPPKVAKPAKASKRGR
jgi:TfoX/Sxy family transcriptional regulator of competence genes